MVLPQLCYELISTCYILHVNKLKEMWHWVRTEISLHCRPEKNHQTALDFTLNMIHIYLESQRTTFITVIYNKYNKLGMMLMA